MSDQGGTASAKARPRSPVVAVGLVVLAVVVIAVVIAALTGGGAKPHVAVPLVTPGQSNAAGPIPGPPSPDVQTPLPSGQLPSNQSSSNQSSSNQSPAVPTTAAPVTTSAGLVQGQTLSGVAGAGTDKAAAFGAWRGKPVDVVVDYVGTRTWDGVTQLNKEGLLDRGLPSSIHRVFSVPLIPSDDGATLQAGANGDYDQHFRDLAQELIGGGQANATIRLGWEMTGNWFAWSGVDHPDQWVGAYRKAVTAMRSVTGADFTFDWTVALHQVDPEPMYPGDDYVDLIGADNYDVSFAGNYQPTDHTQVWNGILTEPWGLNWLADFASKHGKRISIGEWGLSQRDDGHGGGDDPYFIEQMHGWITSHDVAYEAYFESTDPSIKATFAIDNGQFPQAAERYKELFGGSTPATAPPTS